MATVIPGAATPASDIEPAAVIDPKSAKGFGHEYSSNLSKARGTFSVKEALYTLRLAIDVYWKEEKARRVLAERNIELVHWINNSKTETQAMICRETDKNRLILCFRGTQETRDWLTNLNGIQTRWEPDVDCEAGEVQPSAMEALLCCLPGVRSKLVHLGFYTAFMSVKKQLDEHWAPLLRNATDADVYICGHSLGGALSSLAAMYTRDYLPCEGHTLMHYTFGSPRVGNAAFRDMFNKRVRKSYRVVNDSDIVTSAPPSIMFYDHVGRLIFLDEGKIIVEPGILQRAYEVFDSIGDLTERLENHMCSSYEALLLGSAPGEGMATKIAKGFKLLRSLHASSGGDMKVMAARLLAMGVEEVKERLEEKVDEAEEAVRAKLAAAADGVEAAVEEAKEVVEETVEKVSDTVERRVEAAVDAAEEAVEEAVEAAAGVAKEVVEEAAEALEEAVDSAEAAVDAAVDAVDDALDSGAAKEDGAASAPLDPPTKA